MIGEDSIIEVRKKSDNSVVISATLEHGFYQVYPIVKHGKIYTASIEYWHKALGPTSTRFWNTATDIYADGSLLPKRPTSHFCPTCAKYNSKLSIPTTFENTKTSVPFDVVHSDLMGPFQVESVGKYKYMLTFVENTTQYAEVHFLYKKSDATCFIKAFCEKVKTSTEQYPRSFRTDQGGKYVTKELETYFESNGSRHQTTAAYPMNPMALQNAITKLSQVCFDSLSKIYHLFSRLKPLTGLPISRTAYLSLH